MFGSLFIIAPHKLHLYFSTTYLESLTCTQQMHVQHS